MTRNSATGMIPAILFVLVGTHVSPGRDIYLTVDHAICQFNTETSELATLVEPTAPMGVAVHPGDQHVYWVDAIQGRLTRANLDGSNREVLMTGLVAPRAIAIDEVEGWVYWSRDPVAGQSDGSIHRALLNGTGAELVRDMGAWRVTSLVIDPVDRRMYYAADIGIDVGLLGSANMDGSDPTTLWCEGYETFPRSVAVDYVRRQVYWLERNPRSTDPDSIYVSDLNGDNQRVLIGGLEDVGMMTIDAGSGFIYWISRGDVLPGVFRAGTDGAGITQVGGASTGSSVTGMAFDPVGGHVLWTNSAPGRGTIVRLSLEEPGEVSTFGSPALNLIDMAVDLSRDRLYWGENSSGAGTGRISAGGLDGSLPWVVRDSQIQRFFAMAVDPASGRIYWADNHAQALRCSNVDGGDIETIASYDEWLRTPVAVELDIEAGKVYWIVFDLEAQYIMRANLDGANPETLFTTTDSTYLSAVRVDSIGGKIYWSDYYNQRMQRANLDGTDVETLAVSETLAPQVFRLDLAERKMYTLWRSHDQQQIVRSNLDGSNPEVIVDSSIGYLTVFCLDTGSDVDVDGDTDLADFLLIQNAMSADKSRARTHAVVRSMTGPAGQHQ